MKKNYMQIGFRTESIKSKKQTNKQTNKQTKTNEQIN